MPGVVETGLFLGRADVVIVASEGRRAHPHPLKGRPLARRR